MESRNYVYLMTHLICKNNKSKVLHEQIVQLNPLIFCYPKTGFSKQKISDSYPIFFIRKQTNNLFNSEN
jgi:hypothetical protein